MSVLNTQQIMDILPHRSPFLLIDTVEELEPGVKCVACLLYTSHVQWQTEAAGMWRLSEHHHIWQSLCGMRMAYSMA